VAALPIGGGCVVAAVIDGSLPLLVAAAVIGAAGAGLAFRSGLAIVARIAPDDLRGQLTSAFYAASYVGAVVPTVIAGLLTFLSSLFLTAFALAIFVEVLASVSAISACVSCG
jgi:MFS family permease